MYSRTVQVLRFFYSDGVSGTTIVTGKSTLQNGIEEAVTGEVKQVFQVFVFELPGDFHIGGRK
ncbi:MAG: hypothetical protein R3C11_27610 [Planctomycetaceae bacterium]